MLSEVVAEPVRKVRPVLTGHRLLAVWEAATVARWHRNPHLVRSGDSNGAHAWRVAILVRFLFPFAPPELFEAAILHDVQELRIGDYDGEAKLRYPQLAAVLHEVEALEADRMGLPAAVLTDLDRRRLTLCDRLDAFLWMRHCRPDLEILGDWLETRDYLEEEGGALGLGATCGGLL